MPDDENEPIDFSTEEGRQEWTESYRIYSENNPEPEEPAGAVERLIRLRCARMLLAPRSAEYSAYGSIFGREIHQNVNLFARTANFDALLADEEERDERILRQSALYPSYMEGNYYYIFTSYLIIFTIIL